MRATYRNADGTESVGTVIGRGLSRRVYGLSRYADEPTGFELAPTWHIHFDDFTEGPGAFDELYADDPYLVVGVGRGSMADALR